PEMLITDVIMPGLSGPNLAARLMQQNPTLRVLYMSGYTDDAVLRHGVVANGVNFLPKPFTPGAVVRTVRKTLDGHQVKTAGTIN
ncbi:MAG TPA: response regulator, partial [Nitrospiraceae bacterium]|nr:response regulator [Nitrospiraceae bacterium]